MTHLLPKRWTMFRFMLISLLVLSACKSANETLIPESQIPEAQTPEVVTVQGDVVFGPGAFNLPDTKAGLENLSSYKATLTLTFDGTKDGQTEQWSTTYIMLSTKEPVARQYIIQKTGDSSDPDAVFMAEVDGAAYERRGESACNVNVIDQENSLAETWEPAGFLTGVIGAEEAGNETVNDVVSNKYTFDERAFGQTDIAKSTGEMWVASEGSYIVKYLLTTQGNADYFGEGIEGTLTWDYELTEVNQPVTITLPDDCPAGMVNAPSLPDAANILNIPGILAYDTASSVADAATFYQEQIPSLGWALMSQPTIRETNALIEFTQGDQILMVLIKTDAATTSIKILLSKTQQ
jgi:hypothetical protein